VVLKVVMGIGKVVSAVPAPPPSQLISRGRWGEPGVIAVVRRSYSTPEGINMVWIAACIYSAAE